MLQRGQVKLNFAQKGYLSIGIHFRLFSVNKYMVFALHNVAAPRFDKR
jgi:hypothetical protein